MPEPTNPSDIARETLRLLASRRIAPTPENYQQLYHEIVGLPADSSVPAAEKMLENLAEDLPRTTPNLTRIAGLLEKAVAEKEWENCKAAFMELAGNISGPAHPWGNLIHELLRLWETKHSGLTTARKRDGLERVLSKFAADPENLFPKLQALLKSWSGNPASQAEAAIETANEPEAATKKGAPGEDTVKARDADDETSGKLREMVAHALRYGVVAQLRHIPDLAAEAEKLAQQANDTRGNRAVSQLAADLKKFWIRLELRSFDSEELQEGLLRLLRLLIENISELLAEDQWLRGQLALVQEIISHPIHAGVINDAERGLKEAIYKQGVLKQSLSEARATLKNMITTFINRLGEMSESTGEYHNKIEFYSQKITQTNDIPQLSQILNEVLRETKVMQTNVVRTREELLDARRQAETAEQKIKQLESELEQISEMVREDQLTGALNRRGMDDAFAREMARADRRKSQLCVALLDIDNFKQLNDSYGHQAGDNALVHLARVVKETIRPNDVLARFGGEEFLILLPDSGLDEAVTVMARVQRELTKKFFLHNNQRLLITFSAGVALRAPAEPQEEVVTRADKALYQAKQSGKNRVIAAS